MFSSEQSVLEYSASFLKISKSRNLERMLFLSVAPSRINLSMSPWLAKEVNRKSSAVPISLRSSLSESSLEMPVIGNVEPSGSTLVMVRDVEVFSSSVSFFLFFFGSSF